MLGLLAILIGLNGKYYRCDQDERLQEELECTAEQ
jgi:hypothetical protein